MQIHELLASWYREARRDLPWRNTSDPYKIWISEVILQQTRVNQGYDYYERFISVFPDIYSLAGADTDAVLKIWQGLGYYSRALNLHETSKYITSTLNGRFPDNYKDLLSLKGIGPYSAAAIASIVFNEPVAAVDGNVKRVISRLFSVREDIISSRGAERINAFAGSILDHSHPGIHNQAVIELGATICLPKNPLCGDCPLNLVCEAYKDNSVGELPVRYKTKKTRQRHFLYLILVSENDHVIIQKRGRGDIWAGLYEFPLIEKRQSFDPENLSPFICEKFDVEPEDFVITRISNEMLHVLSHQKINARFVHVNNLKDKFTLRIDQRRISIADFSEYPVPRLIDRYISREGFQIGKSE